jgi:hypothetical protein
MTEIAAAGQRRITMPGRPSLQDRYDRLVAAEFTAQPVTSVDLLTEIDLARLPAPVRRFVARSGALGRPKVQNVRVEFDAQMWRKPGQAPMQATSVQYNFFTRPTRLFLMKARMFGLPVRALHVYAREQATFTVRVASLVSMVDQRGDEISAAETVTVLNDMCVFAPGSLVDRHLTWEPIDDRSAGVIFANGPRRVTATLIFNERDELVDFYSDDRPDSSTGTFRPMRWSTPIGDYRGIDGYHLATRGETVYAYPDGPFTYGRFTLRSIAYDVSGPAPHWA